MTAKDKTERGDHGNDNQDKEEEHSKGNLVLAGTMKLTLVFNSPWPANVTSNDDELDRATMSTNTRSIIRTLTAC